jgi:hypothetical protein
MSLPILDSNVFIDSISSQEDGLRAQNLITSGCYYNAYILAESPNSVLKNKF